MSTMTTEQGNIEFNNGLVYVKYEPKEKKLFARCLTDRNNEPACYTTTKRGLAKAWETLRAALDGPEGNKFTHRDVMNVLSQMRVGVHYWCMMD